MRGRQQKQRPVGQPALIHPRMSKDVAGPYEDRYRLVAVFLLYKEKKE
ncbi:hypothetical protein ACFOZY_07510 [Chungangia koreensis]|uniref:Uncharacterized protein n=1 Tax=Chungangia koreensis TaxID=752657 RepID=A0ABV8X4S2_9LACT